MLGFLEKIDLADIGKETPDCSVTKVNGSDKFNIVSSMDFFFPLIDEPYQMGRIGCMNVISDLYAMGVTKIDNILMVLGVCTKMSEIE